MVIMILKLLSYFSAFKMGLEPISYIGVLASTLLHATVQILHTLLNVLVQTSNKMGLQKKRFHL
jgi:hypothetical protein